MFVNDTPLIRELVFAPDIDMFWGYHQNVFHKKTFDVVFFDQPVDDINFLRKAKDEPGCQIVALDYFNCRNNYVDVIINLFNPSGDECARKRHAEYYEGLEFAIIAPGFRRFRCEDREVKDKIGQVLIMMGGADPGLKTCQALDFLSECGFVSDIEVVVGPFCLHEKAIRQRVLRMGNNVRVYRNPKSLPELMSSADIAISGCGTTFFELSFLGTPAIVLSQNEMEHRFCRFLERKNLAIYGGDGLRMAWNFMSVDKNRENLMRHQMQIFDGMGAHRILKAAGITNS